MRIGEESMGFGHRGILNGKGRLGCIVFEEILSGLFDKMRRGILL